MYYIYTLLFTGWKTSAPFTILFTCDSIIPSHYIACVALVDSLRAVILPSVGELCISYAWWSTTIF